MQSDESKLSEGRDVSNLDPSISPLQVQGPLLNKRGQQTLDGFM